MRLLPSLILKAGTVHSGGESWFETPPGSQAKGFHSTFHRRTNSGDAIAIEPRRFCIPIAFSKP